MTGRRLLAALESIVLVVALLVFWQGYTAIRHPLYFTTPRTIVTTLEHKWFEGHPSKVTTAIVPSLERTVGGWLLASAVAIAIGIVIGLVRALGPYVDPVVDFLRSLPPPAILPVFLVLFGVGDRMKVLFIAFGVAWPVLLNTIRGVRSVPRLQLETAQVFGVSPIQRLVNIVVPASSPMIFAGLRISLALALVLMVISEMVAASGGIGYEILQGQANFDFPNMWAGIVVVGIVGVLSNALLSLAEHFVLGWHRGSRKETA